MSDRRDILWAGGLLAFVGLVLVYSLGLREFEFSVPFSYQSDSLQYLAVFRTILTTGWYTETNLLGAPFGATHYDAPVPDGLFLLFVLLFKPFTHDPAIPFNVLYIGGFLAVAASFFYAARALGLPRPFAAAGALAYTFLPFHFLRLTHLFYTVYFIPPLVVAAAVKLTEPGLPPPARWLGWKRTALFIATGAAGVYNAFFLSLVMAFSAVAGAIARRDRSRILHGAFAVALIVGATGVNLLPSILYRAKAGPNPEVAQRGIGESEVYGLKLVQLVLPHPSHPVPAAGLPARVYSASAFVTENNTASLGFIGTAGFLLTLAWLLLRPLRAREDAERIDFLSKLNAFLFLVGTVGGLGVLFALAVSPQLRAWNRVSVVIAAVSLFALLLALARWPNAAPAEALRARRVTVITAVLLLVWAVDEAPQRQVQSQWERDDYHADADFVAKVARAVPPGTMVLELPYTPYPEWPTHFKEGHYGMVRPYLHESTLRWSYGAMHGRESDLWLRALASKPIAEQVEGAARAGFGGIYVERRAYKDHGAEVERELAAILGKPLIERSDGATALYRVAPRTGAAAFVLPPVHLGEGFYGWERNAASAWAWSWGDATLVVTNPRAETVSAILKLGMQTLAPREVRIAAGEQEGVAVRLAANEEKAIELPLTLSPGLTRVRLTTREPAIVPGNGDLRKLAFLVRGPMVEAR